METRTNLICICIPFSLKRGLICNVYNIEKVRSNGTMHFLFESGLERRPRFINPDDFNICLIN